MGRGIVEGETLRTEQIEFEARTSDPADAQPGEYWIRTDQTSTTPQVVAELRRQDQSGVTAAPIFAASEESNLGSNVVRGPSVVLDDGTAGFVAMTTGDGAIGSPRAVTATGAEYVSHDGVELSPTPDSEVYYKIDEGSGSTLNNTNGDSTYEGNLLGTPNWVTDSNARHGSYVNLNDADYLEVANTGTGQLVDFGTDFTIGVDLEINNGLANDATIWEYSDGSNSIHMGKDGSSDNLTACYNGSTTSSSGGIAEPASTYQANVVVQWDSSASDATIYLDQTQGDLNGSQNYGLRDEPLTFGKDTSGSNNGPMNDGVAAVAVWTSIVPPSEFQL